jgi:hypothetical protein
MGSTALAVELRRYKLRRAGESDASSAEVRDSAPRAVVRKWLKGGYASPDSSFESGQVIGAKLHTVDGLKAVYAAGHYGDFVAVNLRLVDQSLPRLKTARTEKTHDAAYSILEYALRSLAGTPIAFAQFDGVEAIRAKDSDNVEGSILRALEGQDRGDFLTCLDDAWDSRGPEQRELALLFEWARSQSPNNYRERVLLAWNAVVGLVGSRARRDETFFAHWREKERWFDDYRKSLNEAAFTH